jgi:copper homeostasis protein (lipoprotein)
MKVRRALVVAIGTLALLGGASSKIARIAVAVAAEQSGSPLGQLPASFSGDLPCADCPGIRYRLNPFPDRAFFLNMTYLGDEDSGRFYDIGSWALSSNDRVLVLKGGREGSIMFRVVDENTLRKLDIEGREIETSLNYTLQRAETFEWIEPQLMMRGMYRYMADAGSFTECLTGQRWFVAQEGDNAALEREYTKIRRQPGEELLINLEGRVEMRPSMEGNALQPTLVVNRFIGVWPGETCGARFATDPLENTYWKLTRLGNKPVFVQDRQREPSLILHPENHRMSGSGGCNRLMGSYTLTGEQIGFGHVASTKMACAEGTDTEQAFLEVLTQVRTWNVMGQHLELYDAKGVLLARFEARHLR